MSKSNKSAKEFNDSKKTTRNNQTKDPSQEKQTSQSEEKIAGLEKEAADWKAQNLRLLADLDNQKKIHQKEISEVLKYGNERLLQQLLSFPDNYERALQVGQHESDPKIQKKIKNFLLGFQMILTEFRNVLQKQGVEEIKVIPNQDTFNDKLHEVLEVEENSDYPDGTVLQVLQKGYKVHDRILRPATVKISKKNNESK